MLHVTNSWASLSLRNGHRTLPSPASLVGCCREPGSSTRQDMGTGQTSPPEYSCSCFRARAQRSLPGNLCHFACSGVNGMSWFMVLAAPLQQQIAWAGMELGFPPGEVEAGKRSNSSTALLDGWLQQGQSQRGTRKGQEMVATDGSQGMSSPWEQLRVGRVYPERQCNPSPSLGVFQIHGWPDLMLITTLLRVGCWTGGLQRSLNTNTSMFLWSFHKHWNNLCLPIRASFPSWKAVLTTLLCTSC